MLVGLNLWSGLVNNSRAEIIKIGREIEEFKNELKL